MLSLRMRPTLALTALLAAAACAEKEAEFFEPVRLGLDQPLAGGLGVLVREFGGQPIAGATVTISGPETRSGTTPANGQVTFDGLLPGNYTVQVQRDGFICPTVTSTVQGGATFGQIVECLPAGGLGVLVRELSGQPIAGASVTISGPETRSGTTATNGQVAFAGLPPGAYLVQVQADGFICPTVTATVQPGATFGQIVECVPPLGNLLVRVVDGDGDPVEGASVAATGPTGRTGVTGPDGTVTFLGIPPGDYTVGAQVPGLVCRQTTAQVQAEQTAEAVVDCDMIAGTNYSLTGTKKSDTCPAGVLGTTINNPGPITFTTLISGNSVLLTVKSDADITGPVVNNQFNGMGEVVLTGGSTDLILVETFVGGFALNSPVVLTGTLGFEFLVAATRQHICAGTYDAVYRKP